MKSKFLFVNTLAIVLLAVAFLFTACPEVQQIEGDVTSTQNAVGGPSKVTAEAGASGTTDQKAVVVKWTAASNAIGYTVYWQEQGKKTVNVFGGNAQNAVVDTLAPASSAPNYAVNTDVDAWSARDTYSTVTTNPIAGSSLRPGIKARFGVSANSTVGSGNTSSKIVWSAYIDL